MLSCSFTKEELQLNQLKHKQLPSQIDFAILQNNTLTPVHYLIKHKEVLPHQKHDSHSILADYGTDQFSIRINDKGNVIVVKSLQSFSFKSVTPFQTKFKTPMKKNNKTLHQQSLLLNDIDITSDDEDHIYTRIPKSDSSFLPDTTLQTENYSTLNKSTSNTPQKYIHLPQLQVLLPTTNITHTRNVTPVTRSKRPRSYISEASSSSVLHRPPITEIPITTCTQQTAINTPIVHIPKPETVEQYVNYKHPTAIKTVRLQPQVNLVHMPDTEYTHLPPLKLPSEISTTSANIYPSLKPLRKPSTSLSNLLDNTCECTPSQKNHEFTFSSTTSI